MTNYKILGFTESNNTCDCCGKSDLKGTYAVSSDENDTLYYGSTCVKRNLGIAKNSEVKNKIDEYKTEIKRQAREFYKLLGGFEIENKMSELEFLSDEWMLLDNKYQDYKKQTKLKFNITNF